MKFEKIEEFSELEFLDYVRKVCELGKKTEEEDVMAVREFCRLAEHPSGSDLIFFPDKTRPNTPEGIVAEVKAWRAANGKPGFKD